VISNAREEDECSDFGDEMLGAWMQRSEGGMNNWNKAEAWFGFLRKEDGYCISKLESAFSAFTSSSSFFLQICRKCFR